VDFQGQAPGCITLSRFTPYSTSQIRAIYNCPAEYIETIEDSLWRIASNAKLFWDSETQTNCLSEYGVLTDFQREQVWQFVERFQEMMGWLH
jgi:hypothetical protein